MLSRATRCSWPAHTRAALQVKILSPEWRKKCRVVDRVQLAGGGDSRRRVYELFTCDHWSQEAVNKKSYKFFLKAFSTAVLLYIQGAWPACQDKLEECIQLKVRAHACPLSCTRGKADAVGGAVGRRANKEAPEGDPAARRLATRGLERVRANAALSRGMPPLTCRVAVVAQLPHP